MLRLEKYFGSIGKFEVFEFIVNFSWSAGETVEQCCRGKKERRNGDRSNDLFLASVTLADGSNRHCQTASVTETGGLADPPIPVALTNRTYQFLVQITSVVCKYSQTSQRESILKGSFFETHSNKHARYSESEFGPIPRRPFWNAGKPLM